MKKKIIVAVDGPAGSGKSSVSKEVAIDMGLKYIDSGAIYRSVTWFFLTLYDTVTLDIDFKKSLTGLLINQDFKSDGSTLTYVNEKDVSTLIRDEKIVKNIGIISDCVDIRDFVNYLLRDWGKKESIIMDGRDIGSIVFPDADLKIYLDASVEIRAKRRVKEYQEMGKKVDENGVKKQITHRDKQDRSREFGALVQADDAVYVDTSQLNKEEVIKRIKSLILSVY